MRVRPFFWFFLAFSCIGVLTFAVLLHTQVPAVMQVQLDQQRPVANGFTTLELHLTDSQGLPIEQAQVLPDARMTNMSMVTNQIRVKSLGHGTYLTQFQLYMAGPWEISIEAHADGFEPITKTLFVQVE
ncbi:MAG TPA: FixH family protein [Ktedonobacteraceae bacterium]|nr:FixH family protein [Ktedonobacteraceae bacterium]